MLPAKLRSIPYRPRSTIPLRVRRGPRCFISPHRRGPFRVAWLDGTVMLGLGAVSVSDVL